MYSKHFGLKENPFRILPDPRFLWYSEQHLEAKEKILYHLNQSAGPILLKADVGMGKTTIARRIAEELENEKNKKVVFVFAPKLTTTNAFLRFVMEEFDVKTERSYGNSLRNFEKFLVAQYKAGVSPILLVDEAQNMDRQQLLLIQHLFNFSTSQQFLIQMALFSQPDIQPKLNRLKSLKSRLGYARLKHFDLQQTEDMIQFRWTVAGGKKHPFEKGAIAEIYRVSGGIAREIVKLANESLIRTALARRKIVDKDTVVEASNELSSD